MSRGWPVEIKNGVGKTWRGRAVDVSTKGMRVCVGEALELRGFMFIAFTPGDAIGPVWTRFSLVREIGVGEYAIRFLDLPPMNIERLGRLLGALAGDSPEDGQDARSPRTPRRTAP
ncbi:MAG: PilZ domain-containing protein [Planctomycetes bacterium]|nr:PilZ domain-containing protein [Candidatus Rokubacteria bacterium]MBI3857432.1 PilZ domain-containing protein [Planctomycetota bacterium]